MVIATAVPPQATTAGARLMNDEKMKSQLRDNKNRTIIFSSTDEWKSPATLVQLRERPPEIEPPGMGTFGVPPLQEPFRVHYPQGTASCRGAGYREKPAVTPPSPHLTRIGPDNCGAQKWLRPPFTVSLTLEASHDTPRLQINARVEVSRNETFID